MIYLLDTCAWLRLLNEPETLSDAASTVLSGSDVSTVGLSSISIWEVAKKESLGKLELKQASQTWLREACAVKGVDTIPLSHEIVWDSCHLPGEFHRDPADQIITATARILDLTLITADKKILAYQHVKTIRAW